MMGQNDSALAAEFGVRRQQIWRIATSTQWKYAEVPS